MVMVDIIILVVIVLSCMMGGFRGLIKEAFSLASWLGAIVIAGLFYETLSGMMTGLIENDSLRGMAAFGIIFVMTIFVGTLLSNLMQKIMSAAGLKTPDRILGAIFGVLRGLIIVGLIIVVAYPFEFTHSFFDGSFFVPYILSLAEQLESFFGNPEMPELPSMPGSAEELVLNLNKFRLSFLS